MPAGDGKRSRGIYLRLRSFAKGGDKFDAGHAITDYDSVANVMAHECAHIVHSKHSVEFYKLMDELFEEWRDGGGGGGRGFTVTGGGISMALELEVTAVMAVILVEMGLLWGVERWRGFKAGNFGGK